MARFLALGIIRTSPDGDFLGSDIARVRLGMALESSGVSLDSVGEAIRTGRLSLGFIDRLLPQPGRLLPRTQRDVIEGLDISWSLADRVRTILGSAGQSPDEPIREDDAEIFEVVARARELGLDDERGIRVIRVIADNVRRIVEAEADVLDEVLTREALASGLSDQEMLDRMAPTRSEYRRLGGRLLDLVNRRLIDEGVIRVLVDYLEAALVREGITPPREDRPPAIAFADLSGFTRLTEERGDRAAATHAGTLAEVAQQAANPHGGQLVKVLGDGAMLFFPDGTAAVHGALELLREARARGLPPARVGIDTGHVIRQDGDYFGTTVNVAARVTDYARPREVLVTSDVVERWTGGDGVLFEEIGPVPLKNVAEPV
ncbi:MAG TPA: adenylate/guanylate cyclase domain-containing protein, partial [Actinomycetota bacterium]|nr:adenylate/guanylate cyclase domain-containing protein [Actinomycetota bacterium]